MRCGEGGCREVSVLRFRNGERVREMSGRRKVKPWETARCGSFGIHAGFHRFGRPRELCARIHGRGAQLRQLQDGRHPLRELELGQGAESPVSF